VISEVGSAEMLTMARAATVLATARLAYVEMRAALAAARRDRRLTPAALSRARRELDTVWASTSPMEVDADLVQAAGDLAEDHGLRGYDAVHLAAIIRLGPPAEVAHVACWDESVRAAAGNLGYSLFPS
jgi:predicted nucleic acid-binding protein